MKVAQELVSYLPHPHALRAQSRQNLSWYIVLGELIDNGFDHGATRVVITSSGKAVEVQDDGRGIADLRSALTIGNHTPSDTTSVGMYGVGLKDAWFSTGDQISVVSVHKGIESSVSLNINDFLPPDWKAPAPKLRETCATSGTLIRLHLRPRKHLPRSDVWNTLSWVFSPVLRMGKQIVIKEGGKKRPLAAMELPPLSDLITAHLTVAGKPVDIEVGITQEGVRVFRGPFWIQYGHRIIDGSSIGAQGYSTDRLGGRIILGKGWALTKNKDDLADFSDELADAIAEAIKPLLVKANDLSEQIESTALTSEIECAINEGMMSAVRESRNSGESSGTIPPAATGRKRRNAAKVNREKPGSVDDKNTKPRAKRGINFGWTHLDEHIAGKYDRYASRVDLNIEHKFVASMKAAGNKDALKAIAISVLAHYLANHRDDQKTAFEIHDFNQCFGWILKTTKVVDEDNK
jgi:hypothetical protein